ncbi:MAG: 50S ribosomal protein L15 [Clostridiales bacterium]|nr:50S ribosomal protein L15 [Clostridiales bacterium]MDR2711737.1 50S ribosomal protein L15 [Clostridiales bacterium]
MNLSELSPAPGSRPKAARVGRGTGSGQGKTSARGHKGQKSRSGGGVRPGFEGGQMPLSRRMPKRGFTNIFRKEIVKVDLAALNYFEDGSVVDANSLVQAGIIRSAKDGVKVLANGTLTKQLTVQCPASKKAAEEITAAGGKVEVI